MASVPWLIPTSMLAHGGLVGAVAESAIALAVVGVFVAVWLRERSARRRTAGEEISEPDE